MKSLPQHIKENNNILSCFYCKRDVYRFIGKKTTGIIMSNDFKPVDKDIKSPKPNSKMTCPYCKKPLVYEETSLDIALNFVKDFNKASKI